MKWTNEKEMKKKVWEEGNRRPHKAFLLLPKTIEQKELKITRWLEIAEWTDEYAFMFPYSKLHPYWKPLRWTDIKETMFQELRDLGEET